eukprot:CAMPEP_0197061614 /NCGR_PEP_ID=MMETSP1384-20130603/138195_1 /TAXON_ID=29189 /ORGANISM="Ammonia sp." /LENGTH=99 /DNA_ID=CAMNT_0042497327 /DNA_START=159 /DNA_END=458 /DNA_ORIENTATION=-
MEGRVGGVDGASDAALGAVVVGDTLGMADGAADGASDAAVGSVVVGDKLGMAVGAMGDTVGVRVVFGGITAASHEAGTSAQIRLDGWPSVQLNLEYQHE